MIAGLYEVHLPVRDLERSIRFYTEHFGFHVGRRGEEPPSALLVLGADRRSMIGLWQAPEAAFDAPQPGTRGGHFALRVDVEHLEDMVGFLEDRGLDPSDRFGEPPTVHAWMPAASVYTEDPDGHLVELICTLPQQPRPDLGSIPLSTWRDEHARPARDA